MAQHQHRAHNPEHRNQQRQRRNPRHRVFPEQYIPAPITKMRGDIDLKQQRQHGHPLNVRNNADKRRAAVCQPRERKQRQRREQTGPDHKGKDFPHLRLLDDDIAHAPAKGTHHQQPIAHSRPMAGAAEDDTDQPQHCEPYSQLLPNTQPLTKQQHAPAQREKRTELNQQRSGARRHAHLNAQVNQRPHRHAENQSIRRQPFKGDGRSLDKKHPR